MEKNLSKIKIALIETSVEPQNRTAYCPDATYSLGMAYIDSILINEGYKTTIKDFAMLEEEECISQGLVP